MRVFSIVVAAFYLEVDENLILNFCVIEDDIVCRISTSHPQVSQNTSEVTATVAGKLRFG